MHKNLAEALISRSVIRFDTEVEARHKVLDISGVKEIEVLENFVVKRIVKDQIGEIIFFLKKTSDGSPVKVLAENVLTIDGMDPGRIAAVYNLKTDGSPKTQGKKRGRKPKDLKAALSR